MKDYIPKIKTTWIYDRPKYRKPFYWIIVGIMLVPVVLLIVVFLMETV